MELSRTTKINKLLDAYPFLKDHLLKKSPKLSKLNNPLLRKTLFRAASLAQVAAMGGVDEKKLLCELAGLIFQNSSDSVTLVNLAPPKKEKSGAARDDRITAVRRIVARLREGEHLDNVRAEIRALLQDLSPAERQVIEKDMIPEDLSENEAQTFGDLQLELFRAASDTPELPAPPPGHPVHTLQAENRLAEAKAEDLLRETAKARDDFGFARTRKKLLDSVQDLSGILRQYERLEKQFAPALKKTGLSPQAWSMHEVFGAVRDQFEKTSTLLEQGKRKAALAAIRELSAAVTDAVRRLEQQILPLACASFSDQDWERVRDREKRTGFAWWIEPGDEWTPAPAPEEPDNLLEAPEAIPPLELETGRLLPQVFNALLDTLPFELTFVGPDNRVAYFSRSGNRIFPRDPDCIGREVAQCHPQKSLHVVEEILQNFKSGQRSTAEFWFRHNERFLLVRYFAVRRKDGTYEGCLEVLEDITELHLLTGHGEKRLLGWG